MQVYMNGGNYQGIVRNNEKENTTLYQQGGVLEQL